MAIFTLLKNGMVKFLKNLHMGLIAKKLFFQIKILNDNNFFLIIIFILVKFKMFIYSPWTFVWSTNIQNALPLVYWPPHGIAIDHSSIGLKKLTSVYSNLKEQLFLDKGNLHILTPNSIGTGFKI